MIQINNENIIFKYIKTQPDLMLDIEVRPKSEYISLSKLYPNMKIISFKLHPVRFLELVSKFNRVLFSYII